MKYLFLDFDGVLNVPNQPDFAPAFVTELNRITDTTGAKIVLSTSWRDNWSLTELRALLQVNKVKGDIINAIQTLSVNNGGVIISAQRGIEILAWCKYNNVPIDSGIVALDDYSDCFMEMFTVKCNYDIGLTPELADEAIAILNQNESTSNSV
jgi:hypothetical protein